MTEDRFGSYRITETLASGAIATVYKGVQDGIGRAVAVKALKEQIAATSSFGEHLEREAQILGELAHPNVVLMLEAGRAPSGRPYIVFEWVDGPSLQQLLAPSAPARRARGKDGAPRGLSVPAALAIAAAICAALEHVHERGVVHRDLKPSNVLFSRAGHVKVIDFGIAQGQRTSNDDLLGGEGVTASGRIAADQMKDGFGTPAYVSPEQILGDYVDGRSDLFSLGVILYEMLSGSRPFEPRGEGDAKRSAAQRIRRDAPAPLRERAPHCPRIVERVVMRLLEKSPSDRYASASAVKERLEHLLRAETREDPAAIVREALADAGASPSSAGADERRAPRATKPRAPARQLRLGRATAGFAAVGLAFGLGVLAIEGTGARAREARDALQAGSKALELAPERAGGLRVIATPWAHVSVDGQPVETTPFARPIPLRAGQHFVTLTHPDAPPVERELTIVAGETLTLEVTMNASADDAGRDAR
jgi:serine/threonine-protein kinase